jgi:hypothetical protein
MLAEVRRRAAKTDPPARMWIGRSLGIVDDGVASHALYL